MGWDGMGWDGMGWDGMGWDGMGWGGMGWGGMVEAVQCGARTPPSAHAPPSAHVPTRRARRRRRCTGHRGRSSRWRGAPATSSDGGGSHRGCEGGVPSGPFVEMAWRTCHVAARGGEEGRAPATWHTNMRSEQPAACACDHGGQRAPPPTRGPRGRHRVIGPVRGGEAHARVGHPHDDARVVRHLRRIPAARSTAVRPTRTSCAGWGGGAHMVGAVVGAQRGAPP
jgi:hypothetical protein